MFNIEQSSCAFNECCLQCERLKRRYKHFENILMRKVFYFMRVEFSMWNWESSFGAVHITHTFFWIIGDNWPHTVLWIFELQFVNSVQICLEKCKFQMFTWSVTCWWRLYKDIELTKFWGKKLEFIQTVFEEKVEFSEEKNLKTK